MGKFKKQHCIAGTDQDISRMLSSSDAVKHRDFSPCLCNGNVQWDEDALLLYLSCIAFWSVGNPITPRKNIQGWSMRAHWQSKLWVNATRSSLRWHIPCIPSLPWAALSTSRLFCSLTAAYLVRNDTHFPIWCRKLMPGALLALKHWRKRKTPFSSWFHFRCSLATVMSRVSCTQNIALELLSCYGFWVGKWRVTFHILRRSFQNRFSSGVSGVTTGASRVSYTSLPPFFYLKFIFSTWITQFAYRCLQCMCKTLLFSFHLFFPWHSMK